MVSKSAQAAAADFGRWLAKHRQGLSPKAEQAAEDVRLKLTILAHGGAESPPMRAKAMADIETLRAELGMVQR